MNKVENIDDANNNIKNIQKAGKSFKCRNIYIGITDNSSVVSKY